jgi:mRNA-binding protein PUF3
VEQIKPQLQALKKITFGKQISAVRYAEKNHIKNAFRLTIDQIEKLIFNGSTAPSQTASPPPGSAIASPPLLTTDSQSPASSVAPSTSLGATEEEPPNDVKDSTLTSDDVKIDQ